MAARRACRALARRQHCWMVTVARARRSSAPPPGSNSCQTEGSKDVWVDNSGAATQQQANRAAL